MPACRGRAEGAWSACALSLPSAVRRGGEGSGAARAFVGADWLAVDEDGAPVVGGPHAQQDHPPGGCERGRQLHLRQTQPFSGNEKFYKQRIFYEEINYIRKYLLIYRVMAAPRASRLYQAAPR